MAQSNSPDLAAIPPGSSVIDAAGEQAQIIAIDHEGQTGALMRTAQGRVVRVPVDLLTASHDGSYRLAFSLALLSDETSAGSDNLAAGTTPHVGVDSGSRTVIPVIEETLRVDKRVVETGSGVRVHKTVATREEVVDTALSRDELEITRVPIDRTLAAGEVPEAGYDGDTLVVPVLEEVLVVEKRWRLKEEVRITRHRREIHSPQTVVLRSENVEVERFSDGKPERSGRLG